jgi:predicted ATPase
MALVMQGQSAEGIAQLQQGLAASQAMGAELLRPMFLAYLGEAYGQADQAEEGLKMLVEALATIHITGTENYKAEVYRLQGELLLARSADNDAEAETSFHHALSIARRQQAKALELRAATSLAKLWHRQGKRQEAYDLLAPVYNWFTEGFDTADLKDAKALLDALRA